MQPNNLPVHGQTPKTAITRLSAATPSDGSGATLLLEAGAKGAVVTEISAVAVGDITATKIILYIQPAGSAAMARKESLVVPAGVQTSDAADKVVAFSPSEDAPLRIGGGDKVYVASLVTGDIDMVAQYIDF